MACTVLSMVALVQIPLVKVFNSRFTMHMVMPLLDYQVGKLDILQGLLQLNSLVSAFYLIELQQ